MSIVSPIDTILAKFKELQDENTKLKALLEELEAEHKRLLTQIKPLRMDTLRASGEK